MELSGEDLRRCPARPDFGLMVTLIWLYLEILRLLAKSRSRR